MSPVSDNSQTRFGSLQRWAIWLGLILLAIGVADGIRVPQQFFRSYLLAFYFWIGFPLGCAAFLMMHYLTGGRWGAPIKRALETAVTVLPFFALLLIPLLFGLHRLFPWAQTEALQDATIRKKLFYLNVPFFIGRQIVYFAVWVWLALRFKRLTAQLSAGHRVLARLEKLSALGLILYAVTVTFFSIDWVMSLAPDWFSTIFGMIVIVAQAQTGFCFAIVVSWLMPEGSGARTRLEEPAAAFNDIGNLQLTFVMLWAYLSFSQFLIIWAGNLIMDISWYVLRTSAAWGVIALAMIVIYFAAPFVILLMRAFKRRIKNLAVLSICLIVANFVYVFWIIVPSFLRQPRFYLLDFLLVVGMGCLALSLFARALTKAPVLAAEDLT